MSHTLMPIFFTAITLSFFLISTVMYSGPNHFLFYKVCTNIFSNIDPEREKKNSCAFEKNQRKLMDKDKKCFPERRHKIDSRISQRHKCRKNWWWREKYFQWKVEKHLSFCKDLAKAAPKLCNFQACLQNSLSPRNPSPKVQTPMTDVAPGYASVMRLNGVISVN